MDQGSISSSDLAKAIKSLESRGVEVRPMKDRIGYYVVDGYVKDAEAIIRDAARH